MPQTFNFNPTADQMVRSALQKCGVVGLGMQVKNEWLQDGRDILSSILKALQAKGVTLTQLIPATLTLVPGVSTYALPTTFIDVENEPTTISQPSGDPTESYVERMVYGDWRIISDKTVNGIPTRVYIQKLVAGCTAIFWSTPDQAYTWNYRGFQLLPDMSDGGQTSGLNQRWMEALEWRLAYWLSFPLNISAMRRAELKGNADEQNNIVMRQESERADCNLMLPMDPYHSY
jgi:hypothetical protein